MSRFALEWVKCQPTSSPIARLVLLLLADDAEGSKHEAAGTVGRLATDANLPLEEMLQAIDQLINDGIVATDNLSTDPAASSTFRLLIPKGWRTPTRQPAPTRQKASYNERPTAVYRFYGHADDLLYVGITHDPKRRFKRHAETQSWWPEVQIREIAWYESRHLALAEEEQAIATEQPAFNAHDGKRATDSIRPRQRTPRLTGAKLLAALGIPRCHHHTDNNEYSAYIDYQKRPTSLSHMGWDEYAWYWPEITSPSWQIPDDEPPWYPTLRELLGIG